MSTAQRVRRSTNDTGMVLAFFWGLAVLAIVIALGVGFWAIRRRPSAPKLSMLKPVVVQNLPTGTEKTESPSSRAASVTIPDFSEPLPEAAPESVFRSKAPERVSDENPNRRWVPKTSEEYGIHRQEARNYFLAHPDDFSELDLRTPQAMTSFIERCTGLEGLYEQEQLIVTFTGIVEHVKRYENGTYMVVLYHRDPLFMVTAGFDSDVEGVERVVKGGTVTVRGAVYQRQRQNAYDPRDKERKQIPLARLEIFGTAVWP